MLRTSLLAFTMLAPAAFAQSPAAPDQPVKLGDAMPATLPPVDVVLDRVESADKDLTGLSATIRYIKKPAAIEGGGIQIRYGTILYQITPDLAGKPVRKFNITFDQIYFDGKLREKDKQSYIFDGQYLIELRHLEQQFTRKHIVGPNQQKDPLRIGEGPFPIPVGQRKADLLNRFDVAVVSPLENAPDNSKLRDVLGLCTQVKLVPKAGTEQAKAFSEIRLWYRLTDMLPIFAQTINVDGSTAEVFLVDLKKNPEIKPENFQTSPPPAWVGAEEDLRDKAEPAPATDTPATKP